MSKTNFSFPIINRDVALAIAISGKPSAGQVINIPITTGMLIVIPAGMSNSIGISGVAANAQADFDVKKNGVSVGTIRFAGAATVPTFIMATATELDGSSSDYLTIVAPASQDANLADIGLSISAIRS